jgi:hypothetical protein
MRRSGPGLRSAAAAGPVVLCAGPIVLRTGPVVLCAGPVVRRSWTGSRRIDGSSPPGCRPSDGGSCSSSGRAGSSEAQGLV